MAFFLCLFDVSLTSQCMAMEILKTYKLFIDGQFPRTESGRYDVLQSPKKKWVANYCRASRKDVKAAVVAAKKALPSWSNRSGFNRSQIVYRIAEIMEGRKEQFVEELILQGNTTAVARKEVKEAIARCVYYAGWCDKFQLLSNTVNPVNTPHFNFTVSEPVGAVGLIAPTEPGLLGLLSTLLPIIIGGNTAVVLASELAPLTSITLAEVLATSDVPAGVVNILTGRLNELVAPLSSHYELPAIVYAQADNKILADIQTMGAQQVKRVFHWNADWLKPSSLHPHWILDTQEIKTTWHPIRRGFQGGSSY
jgi:acyl-CoA reductase-like NAD-dependent aldehyde dehydrogenase